MVVVSIYCVDEVNASQVKDLLTIEDAYSGLLVRFHGIHMMARIMALVKVDTEDSLL